jgi:transcriptional regulator with XRE-family HTH domain
MPATGRGLSPQPRVVASPLGLGALLRRRRRQLGLTLRGLCDRAGLSVGYLSQVENDKAVPTLGTLAQLAEGLEVGLDYFVSQPKATDALSRAAARPRFSLPGSPVAYEAISADRPGSELSSYILHVPPGYASETVTHEGEEIVVVLEGAVEQVLGGEAMVLGPGDSLHYAGATPHSFANRGREPARLLWTGTLPVLNRPRGTHLPRLVAGAASATAPDDGAAKTLSSKRRSNGKGET